MKLPDRSQECCRACWGQSAHRLAGREQREEGGGTSSSAPTYLAKGVKAGSDVAPAAWRKLALTVVLERSGDGLGKLEVDTRQEVIDMV